MIENFVLLNSGKEFEFKPHRFSNAALREQLEQIAELHPNVVVTPKKYSVSEKVSQDRLNSAVVYFLIDVSGSIDSKKKAQFAALAQIMINKLNLRYNNVKPIFITHHTCVVDEVSDFSWLDDTSTGGTIVSSAYEAVRTYKNKDTYVVQLTDGDNWNDDTPVTVNLINRLALEGIAGFKYFEVTDRPLQNLGKAMIQEFVVDAYSVKENTLHCTPLRRWQK